MNTTPTVDPSSLGAGVFGAIFGAFMMVYVIMAIAVWILQGFAFYNMFKKAGQSNAWLAFIPYGRLWPFMWTIKKSAWNILWILCPIANIVFYVIWYVRLLKAFNINPLWLLGMIAFFIPVVNFFAVVGFVVLICYMGFSKNVTYNPNFDQPNVPPTYTA